MKFEQQEPGWNRKFSWAAGLEGVDQESGGNGSCYGGSEKGKKREVVRDGPSEKVVHALQLKQISGPSPVQEELKEEISLKEFKIFKESKELSINTACSEASGSVSAGEGSGSGRSSSGGESSNGSVIADNRSSGEGRGTTDSGERFREEIEKNHKRASTQSQNGTWPRSPGSFPRLSFAPKSPKSPRTPRFVPSTPRTPGERSVKGYF